MLNFFSSHIISQINTENSVWKNWLWFDIPQKSYEGLIREELFTAISLN